ncbi:BTAD domain-containing putative transcriptional regulator [Actinomadura sp. 3N407]|uniref:BTAD domain-containing putative transcriptional regulator n=1 Tax=Actinomadura sp. 3N407 TaxID=3457423 RepID=UPI003FCD909D
MAAVVGVLPLVLAHAAGNPLPGQLPSLDQVRDALARPASDDTLILLVVRDLAWLLWAAFCVSTLLEIAAHTRGRAAPRLLGLGSMQHLARSLITSVTLMTSAPPAVALASAASPPAATAPAVTADLDTHTVAVPHARSHGGPTGPHDTPTADTAPGHHTVHKGDTLWGIAERSLGDGQRWHEIAALNHISDPRALASGSILMLPDQHTPFSDTSGPFGVSTSASPPASPMPNTAFSASVSPLAPAPDAAASEPLQPPDRTDDDGAVSWGPLTAVFATGMIAGGVLTKITQMRHMQRQYRRRGRRIRLPHLPHARHVEQRLAWEAHTATVDQEAGQVLRAALRALAHGLRQANLHPPEIVGVHLAADTVEVLLARPSRVAPEPFAVRPGSNDMCWQLTPDGRTRLLSDDTADAASDQGGDPLPGLINVGQTGPGGQLLVNVETLGVVGCDGDPQLIEIILGTIATEVSTNPWTGLDTVLVGFDELAVVQGRVHSCSDLDEALDLLARRAEAIRRRLGDDANESGAGDVRALRLQGSGDNDLTLLVSRTPPNHDQLQHLLAAVDGTGGLAAILPAATHTEFPARFTLDTDGQHAPALRIEPLHLTVTLHPLTSDDYNAIVTVLTAAADTSDVAADQPPYGSATHNVGATRAPGTDEAFWSVDAEPSRTTTDHTGSDDQDHHGSTSSGETNLLPFRPRTGSTPGSGLSPRRGTLDLPSAPPGPASGTRTQSDEVFAASEFRVPPITPVISPRTRVELAEDEHSAGLSIGVLGPLEVTGAHHDLQPKQLEIVLLLALNPAGLRNDQLRTLLGPDPDHPRGSDSLRQAITRTRRRLGQAADGTERIVHVGDGIYRLHDAELDWTHFQTLVDAAGTHEGDAARKLRQALQLVRGRPLEGCYHWWIDTPLLETIRATIVDAAELLAELDLATGAITGAGRAARVGLIADPAAEQLWRMVMRAEHAAGNTAGVHEAWSGCLRELAAVDTELEPHPDTVDLHHRLTRRPPTAAYV